MSGQVIVSHAQMQQTLQRIQGLEDELMQLCQSKMELYRLSDAMEKRIGTMSEENKTLRRQLTETTAIMTGLLERIDYILGKLGGKKAS